MASFFSYMTPSVMLLPPPVAYYPVKLPNEVFITVGQLKP